MKGIWVKRAKSFKSAEEFDLEYYLIMTSKQRLEIMQFLREMFNKIRPCKINEGRKRLRRTVKIYSISRVK
ncbi:MAG: hypothetical protein ABIL40_00280 [candidate division WOR-3 bacterium]